MKAIALLALFAIPALSSVVISDDEMVSAFHAWQARHGKRYETQDEFNMRLEYFAQNVERINDMNSKHVLLGGEAVFGLNQFSDMSIAEFKAQYLNAKPLPVSNPIDVEFTPRFFDSPPNDVDWRQKGAITPTKDQGNCGSCWAFSATEAVESFGFIAGKGLNTLAPQQIVSCDTYDYGCSGGWPYQAFTYLSQAGGQEGESAYPYTSGTSGQTGSCKFDRTKIVESPRSYQSVTGGEDGLATTLNSYGPPSVCVAAEDWFSYTGGVLRSCSGQVDHCVQAVGYTSDYWIVRNSWGTGWGEAGYIYIARGQDLCLIGDYVTYPTF